MTTDFTFRNEGSLFLLTPHTADAQAWSKENLPANATTWGASIVVEHRYIKTILAGIVSDGLSVEES